MNDTGHPNQYTNLYNPAGRQKPYQPNMDERKFFVAALTLVLFSNALI
jgi:hypothetical protein